MTALAVTCPSAERVRLVTHDKCHVVGRIVADERIKAGQFAAMKIDTVRAEADLGDAIAVLLPVRFSGLSGAGLASHLRCMSVLRTCPRTSARIHTA